jgi:NAD(P)-dependent dehydrogenase (short-subunit alcohol dehydrogenase family)
VTPKKDQRVAIITGASQGIGAGLVAGYRELGWAVVANALEIEPTDDRAVLPVEGDISQPETAERVVSAALGQFGRIDTLVNDAGIYIGKPFADYTRDDYDKVVGVNLTGFFMLTQRVIKEMLAASGGHIVNFSATIAERPMTAELSVLAALTKGGIAAATRSLALEYAHRGIRVNAVSPGVIQTPLHAADSYAASAARTPIGHVGQVSDIVRGVLYLESSPFVTGEILHIDGGRIAGS